MTGTMIIFPLIYQYQIRIEQFPSLQDAAQTETPSKRVLDARNWDNLYGNANSNQIVKYSLFQYPLSSTQSTNLEHHQSGKTLWDWLSLVGILAIAIVLFRFEYREKKRAQEQSQITKDIAYTNLRESALQNYIDYMSYLLVDKEYRTELLDDEKQTNLSYGSIRDIARVRTLTILRILENDQARIARVLYFLKDTELSKFILKGAHLTGLNLKDTYLKGANLALANLFNVNLSGANLSGANLESAKLRNADLRGAELFHVNLAYADLVSADLFGANLFGADLFVADLFSANLSGSKLTNANLSGAKLEGAKLRDANLKEANLLGANLFGCDMFGADLVGANLFGADFERTDLTLANLFGANLERARNLTFDQVKCATNWQQANYDKNFRDKLG
jgi:uncharacterized protein YjbI with pentapeptide repeats